DRLAPFRFRPRAARAAGSGTPRELAARPSFSSTNTRIGAIPMNPDPEPRPVREGDLVADTSGALDRALQQDLQRIRAQSLLARNGSAQELTRALDAALAEPLALNEITGSLERLEGQVLPSFAELEGLLAAPETSGLSMERDLLAELIKDGGEA